MLSERRLRDWVALLGFDVDSVHGYLGFLPMKGGLERGPCRGARLTGGRLLAQGAQARATLTLVRPRRRVRQRVLVGAAEPTNKVGS